MIVSDELSGDTDFSNPGWRRASGGTSYRFYERSGFDPVKPRVLVARETPEGRGLPEGRR